MARRSVQPAARLKATVRLPAMEEWQVSALLQTTEGRPRGRAPRLEPERALVLGPAEALRRAREAGEAPGLAARPRAREGVRVGEVGPVAAAAGKSLDERRQGSAVRREQAQAAAESAKPRLLRRCPSAPPSWQKRARRTGRSWRVARARSDRGLGNQSRFRCVQGSAQSPPPRTAPQRGRGPLPVPTATESVRQKISVPAWTAPAP